MLGRKREVTLHETASFHAEQSLHCFRSFRRSRFHAQNMVQCAAFGCNHNSGNPGVEVSVRVHSFHSFPIKRPLLLKKWLANIRRAQFTPTGCARGISLQTRSRKICTADMQDDRQEK